MPGRAFPHHYAQGGSVSWLQVTNATPACMAIETHAGCLDRASSCAWASEETCMQADPILDCQPQRCQLQRALLTVLSDCRLGTPRSSRGLAGGGSNTSRSSMRRRASRSRQSSGRQCAPHIWWSPFHERTGMTVKAFHARYLGYCCFHTHCMVHSRPAQKPARVLLMHLSSACSATLQLRLSNCTPPTGLGRMLHSHLLHAKLPCSKLGSARSPVRVSPLRPSPCVRRPPAAASQQLPASCRSGG